MESTSAEYLLVDPDSEQLGGGTEVDDDEPDVLPACPHLSSEARPGVTSEPGPGRLGCHCLSAVKPTIRDDD